MKSDIDKRSLLFIDWLSPPNHRNFNRSFFYAISSSFIKYKCIVFSEKLSISEAECEYMRPRSGRFRRGLQIMSLCWKNRGKSIIFLSYDPIFLPIISVIVKKTFVFEHNTTPEPGLNKHSIWQFLLFPLVYRMAQFPAQESRLQKLHAKTAYIGSPLLLTDNDRLYNSPNFSSLLLLAPSLRASLSELEHFSSTLKGSLIAVKQDVLKISQLNPLLPFTFLPRERVEMIENGYKVHGVVVTVQSCLRGTGWFNEAISNRVPIIVTNSGSKMLFQSTFPGYPFVDLHSVHDQTELIQKLSENERFETDSYIKIHNEKFASRFIQFLKC